MLVFVMHIYWDSKLHFISVLLCCAVYNPIKCYGGSASSCPESRLGLAITVKKTNIKHFHFYVGQNVQSLSNSLVFIYCVNVKCANVDAGPFPLESSSWFPFLSTFLLLISVFRPFSLWPVHILLYNWHAHRTAGHIDSQIYTLLFIISVISVVGGGVSWEGNTRLSTTKSMCTSLCYNQRNANSLLTSFLGKRWVIRKWTKLTTTHKYVLFTLISARSEFWTQIFRKLIMIG